MRYVIVVSVCTVCTLVLLVFTCIERVFQSCHVVLAVGIWLILGSIISAYILVTESKTASEGVPWVFVTIIVVFATFPTSVKWTSFVGLLTAGGHLVLIGVSANKLREYTWQQVISDICMHRDIL